MKNTENINTNWTICQECKGRGKKSQKLQKKIRLAYQKEVEQFERTNSGGIAPVRPKAHQSSCLKCSGSGLIPTTNPPISDKENLPNVAIIGGGIGGVAFGVGCFHRGNTVKIYLTDKKLDARYKGY